MERVISREYKLVLKATKFRVTGEGLIDRAIVFWNQLKKAGAPLIRICVGQLDNIRIRREIRFFDTKNLLLYSHDYIFRERKDIGSDKREVTLKFRHPDRYVAQHRDMKSKGANAATKFEEDIKAIFLKLYSFSTTRSIDPSRQLKELRHIMKLYPGLAGALDSYQKKEGIHLVNDMAIKEVVITGGFIPVCFNPLIYAECALIIWSDLSVSNAEPLIVEFSFRYGEKKEKFSGEAAQNSYDLFLLIQENMKSWIDSKGKTKTGFVYDQ